VKKGKKLDAVSRFSAFSPEEVKLHREYRNSGTTYSTSSDLDLMEALIKEKGSDFTFGFALLVRTLAEKNPVGVQEKALRLAKDVWAATQNSEEMGRSMSLLSSLRQQLTSPQNVGLTLFPLREAALESSVFTDMARYFLSLGKACLPGLITALNEEQDRGMRKKLCQLLTSVAREDGVDVLIESMAKASSFLLRNLVMVLGEIRAPQAAQAIVPLLAHTQKIVRAEAVRALCQINTNESQQAVAGIAHQVTDPALKRIIYQTLSPTKYRDVLKSGTWN
jgi:HEAT repeat protein